jgi:hypothetical protein
MVKCSLKTTKPKNVETGDVTKLLFEKKRKTLARVYYAGKFWVQMLKLFDSPLTLSIKRS